MKKIRPGQKIKLTSVEELLGVSNEESAMDIEVVKIQPFRNHPFKVIDDEKMEDLVESIRTNGILSPVLIRPIGNDIYEMVSGHRRMHAAILLGMDRIPAIIREMTDDEAIVKMVDANIQREELLPSEKAFAYKMKMDAMKNQGYRSDLTADSKTSCQFGTKSRADQQVSGQVGESARQVQRFIRLTELIPELLEYVDQKRLQFTVAVEISYIDKEVQKWLYEYIKDNGMVRLNQVVLLRAQMKTGAITQAKMISILNNFKVLGVRAYPLNGVERLQILYETFNPEQDAPFTFQYEQLLTTGLSTKDFVAPTSFVFKHGRHFQMGETLGAASYLQILAPELTDKMLAEFLDMDKNLVVNLHVQSIDQMRAIKLVKGKVTDINRMKIEEQKKAVRSGYDMDIIPSDLMTYGNEAKRLLEDLQSRNERMFLVTVLFLNTAKTRQELDNAVFQTSGIAQKYNCVLRRLDYQQEQGLMSSIPLGLNLVPIKRALTTTSTAIFVPFTTQELFMEGESLYYGLNALSNNMIMVDRKKLKNPNGLILGTPGSGKSFSAKREISNVFFVTKDDVIICDPEGEYYPLVHALGGQVIHISPTSHDYINPMDINLDYSDDDNPLGFKSDFILSLCELIMGSRNGIEPEEKSVIDRCLPIVYRKYFEDPVPENMPTLGDLYKTLREQTEIQAQRIATALEIYVNGSLRVFNHRTNVELDNRIVCFDMPI